MTALKMLYHAKYTAFWKYSVQNSLTFYFCL